MPKLLSAPFFSDNPVFRREEYAAAVGRKPSDKVVSAMLAQHLRAGNIQRIARGVFASVPAYAKELNWMVDGYLAASRLRRDGIIGYHSALEMHGYAYSDWFRVQVLTLGKPGTYVNSKIACEFISCRGSYEYMNKTGVTTIERSGLGVSVTTLERTLVDVFDRYDLAGGIEELFNSIDLIVRINANRLIEQVRARSNATVAGAIGFWLERNQKRLRVPTQTLEELRALSPMNLRYALGSEKCKNKAVKDWNVILPLDVVEPSFEGM